MENPFVPILKKIKGDDNINAITPLVDAQFLMGKSWDVSFKLNFPDILEKHCTIEKVDTNKWTILSHNNASTKLNEEFLTCGLPRILKCGDRVDLTFDIQFQFLCSSVHCDTCNGSQETSANEDNSSDQMENQTRIDLTEIQCLGQLSNPSVSIPSYNNLQLRYKRLLSQNTKLVERLRSIDDSLGYCRNENISFKINSFNSLMEKYSQLFKLKEESNEHQNSDSQLLDGIIAAHFTTIERLQEHLHQLHEDFNFVENYKNNLEGTNQHLNNENVALRKKIAKYIENAKNLNNENNDLQLEIVELKKKHQELQESLNKRLKEISWTGDQKNRLKEVNQNCETVLEVKSRLTELLENEFKCTICDEIFVDALVTNCGHTFCEHCINTWKVIKPTCPICRSILIRKTKSLAIDSYLMNIMPFASDELRDNWLKVVKERKRESETTTSLKRKRSSDTGLNSSSQNSQVTINFEYALWHVYDRLMQFSDVANQATGVIDLTNDGTD